jgi:hypothetical protein
VVCRSASPGGDDVYLFGKCPYNVSTLGELRDAINFPSAIR